MKKLLSIILIVILIGITSVSAAGSADLLETTNSASEMTTVERADALKEMGLFKGTDKGYELEVKPNRTQAIIFLIRMLGEENEALKSTYKCPFTDVPDWAKNYVGYAYAKGYTKGLNEKTFGANDLVSPAQFVTLMLRALGYNDSNGDFSWDKSVEKAEKLGIVNSGKYTAGMEFTRGDCVDIIYSFLQATRKDSDETLIKSLIKKGAVEQLIAGKYGLFYKIIRIPIRWENGEPLVYGKDIMNSVPGAKFCTFAWWDYISEYDYERAYVPHIYDLLVPPVDPKWYDLLTNDYNNLNYYKNYNKNYRLVSTVYDENANMLAASIANPPKSIENGYIEVAILLIDGKEYITGLKEGFANIFESAAEYQDGVIAIKKAHVVKTIMKSRKTGEIMQIIESEDTDDRSSYRFVFNTEKYPELEKVYSFAYGSVPGGKTVKEHVKEFCYNAYITSNNFKITRIFNIPRNLYLTELWQTQSEWNQMYFLILGDENHNLIGYTSIVPSTVKIVDVGSVEQVIYID